MNIRIQEYNVYSSLDITSSPLGAKGYLSGHITGERTPIVIPSLATAINIVKLVGKEESHT